MDVADDCECSACGDSCEYCCVEKLGRGRSRGVGRSPGIGEENVDGNVVELCDEGAKKVWEL